MEEFDYDVKYRKGRENVVADALSRVEINHNDHVERAIEDDIDLASLDLSPEVADEILDDSSPLDLSNLTPEREIDENVIIPYANYTLQIKFYKPLTIK